MQPLTDPVAFESQPDPPHLLAVRQSGNVDRGNADRTNEFNLVVVIEGDRNADPA